MTGATSPVEVAEKLEKIAGSAEYSFLEIDTSPLRAAASMLRELGEREKALREALEKIANHPTGGVGCNPVVFVEIARKELEPK